jgi:hypothetical protein
MSKYILLLIYLISTCACGYLPLKKGNGFDDNVCAYEYSSVYYVKTCKDKGKYCKYIGETTAFCENTPTQITLKTIDESCTTKYECDKGLNCFGKCTLSASASISNNCYTGEEPHKTVNGWDCKKTAIADYCYYRDNNNYPGGITYQPDYFKVCGEISFETSTLASNQGTKYDILTVKSAYIGTVADGKFVLDAKACKSGFALPFYPDSSGNDPSSDRFNSNEMFLKCVNINEIDYKGSNQCIIKYDTDKLYDISKFSYSKMNRDSIFLSGHSLNNYDDEFCDENLMTKLDMFSKYIGIFTEEKQKNCETKENYNEPATCNDNELRKWLYYYNHPEHYILYYKEDGNDVANFLIQQEYPLYESSRFLYIKYITSLLFLLLFF